MKRTDFFHKVVVEGTPELDLLWGKLSEFDDSFLRYAPGYYRVTASDVLRPDLISYKVYGTVDFWWIILLLNNIENPFVELEEGMVLKVPNKLDIYEFRKKCKL